MNSPTNSLLKECALTREGNVQKKGNVPDACLECV